MHALIVGEDPEERDLYAFALRQVGFTTQQRTQLDAAMEVIHEGPADLLLVLRPTESNLPERIRSLRDISNAPLVFVLEEASVTLQLASIRAGADLILGVPSDPRLVAAYSLNFVRRAAGIPGKTLPTLSAGDLTLDPASRTATLGGADPIRLTKLEFRLLYLLLSHQGQVIETEDLVERVWGYEDGGTQDLARGLVSRLRKKLGDSAEAPTYIETIPSVGYRLRSE